MVDLKVWGEYACFSRPEFKVERVSYPVITPSAARGLLEAIFWKPQMRYRIQKLGILRLGSQVSILRNEISDRQSPPRGKAGGPLIVEDARQQRSSLVLKNVCYRIKAWIDVLPGVEQPIGKFLDCFRRRSEQGQYFSKPFLGCREFAADFEPATDADVPPPATMAFGTMLFDIAYVETQNRGETEFYRHDGQKRRVAAGCAHSIMWNAELKDGWLCVPQGKYEELDRMEARHGIA